MTTRAHYVSTRLLSFSFSRDSSFAGLISSGADGVDLFYSFPKNLSLASGATLLIVGDDVKDKRSARAR